MTTLEITEPAPVDFVEAAQMQDVAFAAALGADRSATNPCVEAILRRAVPVAEEVSDLHFLRGGEGGGFCVCHFN